VDEHVIKTYARAPEVFVRGQGSTLYTEAGEAYLDLLSGIGVNALGHGHPDLVQALQDQAGRLLHVSNLFRHPWTEQVARHLAAWTGLDATFFCNSGTEAVEGALKLARKAHVLEGAPRSRFVALERGFHGRTFGSLAVTAKAAYREPFAPLVEETQFVPPDDVAALQAALESGAAAALILEPLQGEGGVHELSADYLRLARELCDATGTLLIHDEVQSGCGRTGTFLAAQHAGVTPDIVTLAKPLAAGLPMGAVVCAPELADVLQPGDHGSTFGGGPLALRAALIFLQELNSGLLDNVAARGAELRDGLLELAREHDVIRAVRGRGLMLGLELKSGAAQLCDELYRRRIIAGRTAGDVVRFLPPFVLRAEEVGQALEALAASLEKLAPVAAN